MPRPRPATSPRSRGTCKNCCKDRRIEARDLCYRCYGKEQGYNYGSRHVEGTCSNCSRSMRLAKRTPSLCMTCYVFQLKNGRPRPVLVETGLCCWACKKPIAHGKRYIRDANQAEDFHPKCFDAWVSSLGNYETRIIINTAGQA
jgi:hypothetical protein